MHFLLLANVFMAIGATQVAAGQAAPAAAADPAAYALLKAAHDGRSAFPADRTGATRQGRRTRSSRSGAGRSSPPTGDRRRRQASAWAQPSRATLSSPNSMTPLPSASRNSPAHAWPRTSPAAWNHSAALNGRSSK